MAAFRERFRVRAAADREKLSQALARSDRGALRQLAHDLAGTAGTFGFHDIGDAAMILEDRLIAQAPDKEIGAACHDLIEKLAGLA